MFNNEWKNISELNINKYLRLISLLYKNFLYNIFSLFINILSTLSKNIFFFSEFLVKFFF